MSELGNALRDARAQLGLSQAEVARRWGVSPRMIRKIESGAVPGARYERSVAQLGRGVAVPPERRLAATGAPVKVRAPGGRVVTPTVAPPVPQRGSFGVQAGYTRDGNRATVVTMPRSAGIGRERGRAAILDELRGLAGRDRHVMFTVRTADGRTLTLGSKGGYRAGAAYQRSRAEGNDPLAFLADDLSSRYNVTASSILEVTVAEFAA